MADEILVQSLGVSFQRDERGLEGLVYSPSAIVPEEPNPEAVCREIDRDALRVNIDQLCDRIGELMSLALLRRKRDGIGVESTASQLAEQVLPDKGFFTVVKPGVHPQFDISSDIAAAIPWEVLEERYLECPEPDCTWSRVKLDPEIRCCPRHGKAVREGGGKLALQRHLSHQVRGGDSGISDGMQFLLIKDPLGDLAMDPADDRGDKPNADPDGECAEHLVQIEDLLESKGYPINVIPPENATRTHVTSAIKNPSLGGIYYFGHGCFPRDDDQGHLVLRDGRLSASEIAKLNPRVRFVFLNACQGASRGRAWTLEHRVRSVAEAFARGSPAKTVIAPIFPIVNVQAARAALEFFHAALDGQSCGEALQRMRLGSYARYSDPEQDLPDISWMAYRYFGNPNRTLRPAQPKKTIVVMPGETPASESPGGSRLFDQDNKLDTDAFGFGISDALFRAAKRRQRQCRALAGVGDLVVGLIRVGDLTRYMCGQYGLDCDGVYEQVVRKEDLEALKRPATEEPACAAGEDGAPGRVGEKKGQEEAAEPRQAMERTLSDLRRLIAQFLIRKKDEFDPDLIGILDRADQAAQRAANHDDRRISEHDVLEAIAAAGRWPADLHADLPPADWVAKWLAERESEQTIDANGRLRLSALAPDAVRVVEAAHALAQQRGITPIPNRLVLAAFFDARDGYSAELCRRHGADPAKLAELLLALTRGGSPETFVLSHASCQKVVIPMLERARRLQDLHNQAEVSEALLLKAYCQVAQPAIKKLLLALDPPLRLDLDKLAAEPLPQQQGSQHGWNLDSTVRHVVQAAAQFAYAQGYTEIRSPHLFAALVSEGKTIASVLLRRDTHPQRLIRTMLLLVPPKVREQTQPGGLSASRSVVEILRRADVYARAGRREAITENDLRKAILENPNGAVVQSLESLGLNWLLVEDFEFAPGD